MKITDSPMISLQEIFEQTLRRQSVKIIYDTKHVLHNEFQLLPYGRRNRTPPCRLNRYKYSFDACCLLFIIITIILVCFTVYLSAAFIEWFYVYIAVMSILISLLRQLRIILSLILCYLIRKGWFLLYGKKHKKRIKHKTII